jgi:hypothetical protein
MQAAQIAKDRGLKVFTILIGNGGGGAYHSAKRIYDDVRIGIV